MVKGYYISEYTVFVEVCVFPFCRSRTIILEEMVKGYYISEYTVFLDVLFLSFAVAVAYFSHIFFILSVEL